MLPPGQYFEVHKIHENNLSKNPQFGKKDALHRLLHIAYNPLPRNRRATQTALLFRHALLAPATFHPCPEILRGFWSKVKFLLVKSSTMNKIHAVQITSFKRLDVAEATINETGLTLVGGKNKQGKSSFLDAIMNALAIRSTAKNVIREGASKAVVSVTLDEFIVSRTWNKNEDGSETSKLSIKTTSGDFVISKPMDVLKNLMQQATIDPMAFIGAEPAEQRKQLMALAGCDTTEIDENISLLTKQEKEIAVQQNAIKAIAEKAINAVPPEGERPNIAEHKKAVADAQANLSNAVVENQTIASRAKRIDEIEEEIKALKAKQNALIEQGTVLIDTNPFREIVEKAEQSLESAQAVQTLFDDYDNTQNQRAEWKSLESKLAEVLEHKKDLQNQKKEMLAEANLPDPRLSFDGGSVLVNGQLFANASQAEQIEVSVAMALAASEGIKVAFVKNGSLFDADTLKQLQDTVEKLGGQLLVEVVASPDDDHQYDKELTIVIEDGVVLENR